MYWVSTPPIPGPRASATPPAVAMTPIPIGWICLGRCNVISIVAVATIMAAATPWKTRNPISETMSVAMPQKNEARVNNTNPPVKIIR